MKTNRKFGLVNYRKTIESRKLFYEERFWVNIIFERIFCAFLNKTNKRDLQMRNEALFITLQTINSKSTRRDKKGIKSLNDTIASFGRLSGSKIIAFASL